MSMSDFWPIWEWLFRRDNLIRLLKAFIIYLLLVAVLLFGGLVYGLLPFDVVLYGILGSVIVFVIGILAWTLRSAPSPDES